MTHTRFSLSYSFGNTDGRHDLLMRKNNYNTNMSQCYLNLLYYNCTWSQGQELFFINTNAIEYFLVFTLQNTLARNYQFSLINRQENCGRFHREWHLKKRLYRRNTLNRWLKYVSLLNKRKLQGNIEERITSFNSEIEIKEEKSMLPITVKLSR